MKQKNQISWANIENGLDTLLPAKGGNSDARRGIITVNNGAKVFVKIGTSENTKAWATKEIEAYNFLAEYSYPYAPRLLSVNQEKNGFAIEALLIEEGWDWSDAWNSERLRKTFLAMDELANIKPDDKYTELLKPTLTNEDNGWIILLNSTEKQASLLNKLRVIGMENLIDDIALHARKSTEFNMQTDTLAHFDVRADNCAWNSSLGEVRLVDWNWLHMGDGRIDLAALLTHVHKSGLDVLKECRNRLHSDALHWIAGFWLEAASKPIWLGGPAQLRDVQLQSGITALDLAERVF